MGAVEEAVEEKMDTGNPDSGSESSAGSGSSDNETETRKQKVAAVDENSIPVENHTPVENGKADMEMEDVSVTQQKYDPLTEPKHDVAEKHVERDDSLTQKED